uniref:Uncharacterized protein n=1 Tax=Quercus lobata TaxID=97700 RepID=A0A7N2KQW6_QUELO
MFSTIPLCSWPDLNPKTPWDLKPRDLSDETPPSNPDNNVPYEFDHDSSTFTSKLRNHQISGATKPSAAAAIMLQQQLFMSCGASAGADESGLIQMSLSLGASDDVVDGSSSFKSPNIVSFRVLSLTLQ